MATTYTWLRYTANSYKDYSIVWDTSKKVTARGSGGIWVGCYYDIDTIGISNPGIGDCYVSNNGYGGYDAINMNVNSSEFSSFVNNNSNVYIAIASPGSNNWSFTNLNSDVSSNLYNFDTVTSTGVIFKYVSHSGSTLTLYQPDTVTYTTVYSKGNYVDQVTSTSSSAYPKDGRHSDGYWYVYQGNYDLPSAGNLSSIGSLSVGAKVKIKVNGTSKTFIIIHQGNPDTSKYDSSCNGTWLMMEEIYTSRIWMPESERYSWYQNSDIHTYLNGEFLNLIDKDVKNIIKQVKIPYTYRESNTSILKQGSEGLSTKVFLLSYIEYGADIRRPAADGVTLNYFSDETYDADFREASSEYWTRTPNNSFFREPYYIEANGAATGRCRYHYYTYGVRPALILPSTTKVDSSGNIVANVAPTTPGIPTLPDEVRGGKSVAVSWAASTDSDGNLAGYQLQVQLDGGSWTQVYQGSSNSYNYTIPQGTSNIAFRVRAYDSASAYSSYATSTTYAVTNLSDYGYVTIDGASKFLTGEGYATIGGILRPLVKYFICHNSVWKSMLTGTEIVSTLPDGYVQLEYIKSSGTQYIDTGYKANGNTRVVLDFELTDASANLGVFGGRTANNSNTYTLFWVANTGYRSDYNTGQNSISGVSGAGRHTVDKNKGVTAIDGVTASATSATFDSGYNMYLGTINTAGTAFASGLKGNIYSCQIYDNGTLIRNFIPCMSPDGIVGLYDTSGGTFYTNNGTGEFVAGEPVSMSCYPVPKNFIQTEYIESTGTQWIDTGYKFKSEKPRVVLDFYNTNTKNSVVLCGCETRSPSGTNGTAACIVYSSSTLTPSTFTIETSSGATGLNLTMPVNNRHSLDITANNGSLEVLLNGETYTKSYTGYSNKTDNFALFADNIDGTAYLHSMYRLYACQIYDNDKLVRDFVPCINASGVAGLWDKVNGKFYGNSGSGSFIAGNFVTVGVKHPVYALPSSYTQCSYIESSGSQYIDTGFIPNRDTRIDISAMPFSVADVTASGIGFIPYGAGVTYNSNAFECYTFESKFQFNYANTHVFIGSAAAGNIYDISHNKNKVNIIGTEGAYHTFAHTNISVPYTMTLFGLNRGSVLASDAMRLYYCRIYDNGVLIRDYIPCVNSSGKAGLWDTVNGVFYGNAGTGSFTAGN